MPKPKAKADARSRFEEDESRGVMTFLIRPLLNSPKDALAVLVAAAMVAAIIGNALFMQAGRHPSPMFSRAVPAAFPAPVNPMPRSRPLEADARPAEARSVEAKPPAQPEPRANDPMGQLVARTVAVSPTPAAASVMRPPAPIPAKADPIASQRRVAAVQRALTDFGYAQLRPTGVAGTDTQAAISKFEKERKLPVTGQVSDRLVRELSAVTGRPIE